MSEQPTDHAAFQIEVYLQRMADIRPTLPFTFPQLQEAARARLDAEAYGYVAGGAGLERTVAANQRAFDRWAFVPRMMRDVSQRDGRVELLGRTLPSPLVLAPVGVQGIIHPDGEVASASAAAELGLLAIQSTAASRSLEEVAEATDGAPRWFQLYWPSDRSVAASLVQRAAAAGYEAIVVTLDTKFLAYRPRDLDTAYLPFLYQEGVVNWFSDPAFRASLTATPEENPQLATLQWAATFADRTITWDDLAWLREQTDLPILVKGVQHPEDARSAVQHGVDGIIVSNHGGRQVDGAVGALELLPACVAAVAGAVPVLFDSGVRSGADVAKAVALGASAVLVGRAFCWGLALDGQAGVRHVLRSLLAEYELTLSLLGCNRTGDLTPELLQPAA